MNNYWTCSQLADRLRGTKKLSAGTSDEWDEWEQQAKAAHPVRWWIAEEGLDILQKIVYYIPDKIYSFKYYINNRYITRTHCLTAHPRDIKPGKWQDVGNRFLPCLFNELVDFVEVELAWWHIAWADPEEKAKYNPPFWATGWFRWRTWRCPQAGLDNLEWQRNLVWKEDECEPGSRNIGEPTYQAVKAQEILDLYRWWTEVYPNRPEPHDASGWSEFCNRRRGEDRHFLDLESRTPEEAEETSRILDLCHKIEQDQEQEDEEMMIRLIKVRNSLWT